MQYRDIHVVMALLTDLYRYRRFWSYRQHQMEISWHCQQLTFWVILVQTKNRSYHDGTEDSIEEKCFPCCRWHTVIILIIVIHILGSYWRIQKTLSQIVVLLLLLSRGWFKGPSIWETNPSSLRHPVSSQRPFTFFYKDRLHLRQSCSHKLQYNGLNNRI